MAFDTPTTKTEMYEILKEIYSYYRLRQRAYDNIPLSPLTLTRLSFTPLTDEQLAARAVELLKGDRESDIKKATEKTQERLAVLQEEYGALTAQAESITETVNAEYAALAEKIKKSAERSGVTTDYVFDKLAALESEKQRKLTESLRENGVKITANRAEVTALQDKLDEIEDYYDDIYDAKAESKTEELKMAQEAAVKEAFIYNNGLDEKEQKYANQITQSQMSLEIKYIEATKLGYTKEQLVDMGYYADVIDCVCAYYDTLEAVAAYNDIKNETGLMPYLDDFYDTVIYIYKTRAL